MTNKTDKIVSEAIRQFNESPDSFIYLSTGVILKPVRVPSMIFPEIASKFKKPKVPVVFIADIGREEENPSDPNYIDAVNEWNTEFSKAVSNVMILLGTEIHFVPENMESPDSKDGKWFEKLAAIGLDYGSDKSLKYLYWVKFYAAPSDSDIQKIMEGVGRLSGVAESDVQDAVEQFRDNA